MTWKRRLAEVTARCGSRCWYCGRQMINFGRRVQEGEDFGLRASVDHFQPTSRGGAESPENLVPACSRCNTVKGNRQFAEARTWLILARLGWPSFSTVQIDWLAEAGFDISPVLDGRLYFEEGCADPRAVPKAGDGGRP
jgi:hypothetical protein